jgi:hypothetical protein
MMRIALLFSLVVLLFCSFGNSIPISIEARESVVVERCLKAATQAIKRLSATVLALHPWNTPADLQSQRRDIDVRSQEVIDVMKDGAGQMRRSGPILTIEVARVVEPVSSVQQSTETLMTNWISAKKIIVRMDGREHVLGLLSLANTATDDFIDAVISRLPLADRGLGRLAAQRSKDAIEDALKAYRKP